MVALVLRWVAPAVAAPVPAVVLGLPRLAPRLAPRPVRLRDPACRDPRRGHPRRKDRVQRRSSWRIIADRRSSRGKSTERQPSLGGSGTPGHRRPSQYCESTCDATGRSGGRASGLGSASHAEHEADESP